MGYYLNWDFSERTSGKANMAVLSPAGKWQRFSMNLVDLTQREAFLYGQIPYGVKIR